MPRSNGTGPVELQASPGRGGSGGGGRGAGSGGAGGRGPGAAGGGAGGGKVGTGGMQGAPRSGECTCPSCDTKAPHQPGIPCFDRDCPNCGARMIRK